MSSGDLQALQFGRCLLDPVHRRLLCDGEPVKLPPKLFDALAYLAENAGRVVGKDELMAAVWGGRIVEEGSLSQTIFMLRRAIQDVGGESCIVTAPGRGYRFAAEIRRVPSRHPAQDALGAGITTQPPPDLPDRPTASAVERRPARRRLRRLAGALAMLLLVAAGLAVLASWRLAGFAPPPHSVAVLPFVNLSGDPAQAYLSDGLSEELIDALGRVNALKVAARTSSFSFRSSDATAQTIGRQLKVGALLEGSVRRDGQVVRITAQLIDTSTGYQFWSRSYSRTIRDILALQDEIAVSVVAALKVTLLGGEPSSLTIGGTRNPEAYDAELRAEHLLPSVAEATQREALAAFDEALRLDPSYSDAHAGRSRALLAISEMWEKDLKRSDDEAAEAMREADQAVALAPDSAVAHLARSAQLSAQLDLLAGAAEAAIALDLNPGNAVVQRQYARMQAFIGHRSEAESAMFRVLDLDPLTASNYATMALIFYVDRKYDEALMALRREQAIGGDDPERTQMLAAMMHLAQGRPQAALDDCEPGCRDPATWRAIAYKKLGREVEAQASLAKVPADNDGDFAPPLYAYIYAQWGDDAAALHWLGLAVDERSPAIQGIQVDPLFDPIRETPGFKEIERRMNIPP